MQTLYNILVFAVPTVKSQVKVLPYKDETTGEHEPESQPPSSWATNNKSAKLFGGKSNQNLKKETHTQKSLKFTVALTFCILVNLVQ